MSSPGLISLFYLVLIIFHCLKVPQFIIYSPIEGHLHFFQVLAVMNKADILQLCTGFLCGLKLSVLRVNTEECNFYFNYTVKLYI